MTVIEIEVISDFVCAWCFIAKHNLDTAISLYQKTYPGGNQDTFALTWTPYYLNYNPNPQSVAKHTLVDIRLPNTTPEQRAKLQDRMARAGRAVGINFNWGGMIGPDTRDAHRLIHLIQSKSKGSEIQNTVVEAIFEAYHVLQQDISELRVLTEIAVRAGLDEVEVNEWFESSEGMAFVDQEAKRSKAMLNAGVPMFLVQGKHRLDATPDPMNFMELFIKVKEPSI